jgi:hypothetical protein
MQRQSGFRRVARGSRWVAAGIGALAIAMTPLEAGARTSEDAPEGSARSKDQGVGDESDDRDEKDGEDDARAPEDDSRMPEDDSRTRHDPERSYASALTWAYVLAPLLALPTGAGLFELTGNDTVAVVGAGLAVVSIPVTVHAVHDEGGRSVATGLLLPTVTAGGVLLGGAVGYGLGGSGCDDSDCELAGEIGGMILGALIGGVAGYVGFAIYDVGENSSRAAPRNALGSSRLQLWAAPLVSTRERAVPGEGGFDGMMLGARWVQP